jgi:anti-sigma factor RsiW
MNCEWRQKAVLFADDELGPAEQEEVSAHVSRCAECASTVTGQMELKKAVRIAGRRFTAPAQLRANVLAGIPASPRRRPVWQWVLAPAALLALAALAFLLVPQRRNDSLLAEMVDQHITTLASQNPVDVVSTDRHTVKPWFQGKLPFSFSLPDLAGSQFVLLGGKMVYVERNPGAELLYEIRKHRISIFVFQADSNEKPAVRPDHPLGFTVETWRQAGLQFSLVTDVAPDDARRLKSMFEDANKP